MPLRATWRLRKPGPRGWTGALDAPELRADLQLAFSLGLTLANLREIAQTFYQDYDLLEGASFPHDSSGAAAPMQDLVAASGELARLCQYSRLGSGDVLYAHVEGLLQAINGLTESDLGTPTACRLLQRLLPIRQGRGRQGDWDTDPETRGQCLQALEGIAARPRRRG